MSRHATQQTDELLHQSLLQERGIEGSNKTILIW